MERWAWFFNFTYHVIITINVRKEFWRLLINESTRPKLCSKEQNLSKAVIDRARRVRPKILRECLSSFVSLTKNKIRILEIVSFEFWRQNYVSLSRLMLSKISQHFKKKFEDASLGRSSASLAPLKIKWDYFRWFKINSNIVNWHRDVFDTKLTKEAKRPKKVVALGACFRVVIKHQANLKSLEPALYNYVIMLMLPASFNFG